MFREMKRKERQLSAELTEKILNKCTSGVLSVIGDDGYPYGVPVSYAYSDGKIFFHCAKEGHKVDAIKNKPKVSFTVIAQDDVIPEKYGTDFASVIAFGKASFVEDPEEMLQSHIPIIEKYSNEYFLFFCPQYSNLHNLSSGSLFYYLFLHNLLSHHIK